MRSASLRLSVAVRLFTSWAFVCTTGFATSYPPGVVPPASVPVLLALPRIDSPQLAKAVRGVVFSHAVSVTNADSVTATGLPDGLSINRTSFVISGVPAVAGNFLVAITATNGGGSVDGSLALLVVPPPPRITSTLTADAMAGQAFSYQIEATEEPFARCADSLPAGLQMDCATGVISGTPRTPGVFHVAIVAQNDGGSTTAMLAISIADPALPPVVEKSQLAKGVTGSAFSHPLAAVGADSFTSTALPDGLTLDATTGIISGSPTTAGNFLINFTATNGAGSDSGVLALLLVPPPPRISLGEGVDLVLGEPFSMTITASHRPLSVCADGLPTGLSIDCANGNVTGTPVALGDFPVHIVATNDGGTGERTVTFRVATQPVAMFLRCDLGIPGSGGDLIIDANRHARFFAFRPGHKVVAIEGDLVLQTDGSFQLVGNAAIGAPGSGSSGLLAQSSTPFKITIAGDVVSGDFNNGEFSFGGQISVGSATGSVFRMSFAGEQDGTMYVVVAPDGSFNLFVALGATGDFGSGIKAIDGTYPTVTTISGGAVTIDSVADSAIHGSFVSASGEPSQPIGGLPLDNPLARYLVNLSSRAFINGNANPAIVGFVVTGTTKTKVLLRAAGPALALLGVTDPIADPHLVVYDQQGHSIGENDDWSSGSGASEVTGVGRAVGAFPFLQGSADAAIVVDLDPGIYSAAAFAKADSDRGVSLVEVYDADPTASAGKVVRLVNSSCRAWVEPGDHAMIAGLVITGNYPKRVVVRGIGPGLAAFQVGSPLADPEISLYHSVNGQSALVASNDDWWNGNDVARLTAAFTQVGAFALGASSTDAALVLTLEPGAYTVVLGGKAGSSGNALIEVYEADLTP